MTIVPCKDQVYIEFDEVSAGALDTSGRPSAQEYATVIAVGPIIGSGLYLEVGDKILVKSWAVDIIMHGDKKYHFVDVNTRGIKAVVKE